MPDTLSSRELTTQVSQAAAPGVALRRQQRRPALLGAVRVDVEPIDAVRQAQSDIAPALGSVDPGLDVRAARLDAQPTPCSPQAEGDFARSGNGNTLRQPASQ
jgi:hypothetical protein